jgi:hypothetical protein
MAATSRRSCFVLGNSEREGGWIDGLAVCGCRLSGTRQQMLNQAILIRRSTSPRKVPLAIAVQPQGSPALTAAKAKHLVVL